MSLLESEIHRLILGYLMEDAECPRTADLFLEESGCLAEVKRAMKRNRHKSLLSVGGNKLSDFLDNNNDLEDQVHDLYSLFEDERYQDHPEVTTLRRDVHRADSNIRKVKAVKELIKRLLDGNRESPPNANPNQAQKRSTMANSLGRRNVPGLQKRQKSGKTKRPLTEKENEAMALRVQHELMARSKLKFENPTPQTFNLNPSSTNQVTENFNLNVNNQVNSSDDLILTSPEPSTSKIGDEFDSPEKSDSLRINSAQTTPSKHKSRKPKNPHKIDEVANLDFVMPHPSEHEKNLELVAPHVQSLLVGFNTEQSIPNDIFDSTLDTLANILKSNDENVTKDDSLSTPKHQTEFEVIESSGQQSQQIVDELQHHVIRNQESQDQVQVNGDQQNHVICNQQSQDQGQIQAQVNGDQQNHVIYNQKSQDQGQVQVDGDLRNHVVYNQESQDQGQVQVQVDGDLRNHVVYNQESQDQGQIQAQVNVDQQNHVVYSQESQDQGQVQVNGDHQHHRLDDVQQSAQQQNQDQVEDNHDHDEVGADDETVVDNQSENVIENKEEIVAEIPAQSDEIVLQSRKRPNPEFTHIIERKKLKLQPKEKKPPKIYPPPSRSSKRFRAKRESKRKMCNLRVCMSAVLTKECEEKEDDSTGGHPNIRDSNDIFAQVGAVKKAEFDQQEFIIYVHGEDGKSTAMTSEMINSVLDGTSSLQSLGFIDENQLNESGGIIQLEPVDPNAPPQVILDPGFEHHPESSPLHQSNEMPIIATPKKIETPKTSAAETPAAELRLTPLRDFLSTEKKRNAGDSEADSLATPVLLSEVKSGHHLTTPTRNASPEEHHPGGGPQYFTPTPPVSSSKEQQQQDTPGLKFLQEMSSQSEASCSEDSQSSFGSARKKKSTSLSVRARNQQFRKNIGLSIEESINKTFSSPEKRHASPVRHFAALGMKKTPIKSPLKPQQQHQQSPQHKFLALASPNKMPGNIKVNLKTPEKSPLKGDDRLFGTPTKTPRKVIQFGTPKKNLTLLNDENFVLSQVNFGTPTKFDSPERGSSSVTLKTPTKTPTRQQVEPEFKTPIKTPGKSKAQMLRLKQEKNNGVKKRATLIRVEQSSPLRSAEMSNWEAKHDVNNLDNYTMHQAPETEDESGMSSLTEDEEIAVLSADERKDQESPPEKVKALDEAKKAVRKNLLLEEGELSESSSSSSSSEDESDVEEIPAVRRSERIVKTAAQRKGWESPVKAKKGVESPNKKPVKTPTKKATKNSTPTKKAMKPSQITPTKKVTKPSQITPTKKVTKPSQLTPTKKAIKPLQSTPTKKAAASPLKATKTQEKPQRNSKKPVQKSPDKNLDINMELVPQLKSN